MKQERKNTRADILLAVMLILGSLVLAGFSWWLPSTLQSPMTADMVGAVSGMEDMYDGTRVGFTLDDNTTKFTFVRETYEALPRELEMGDNVVLKYEISSLHEVRYLQVTNDDGSADVLYQAEDPTAKIVRNRQITAFVIYGIYAAVCVGVYLIQTKRRREVR